MKFEAVRVSSKWHLLSFFEASTTSKALRREVGQGSSATDCSGALSCFAFLFAQSRTYLALCLLANERIFNLKMSGNSRATETHRLELFFYFNSRCQRFFSLSFFFAFELSPQIDGNVKTAEELQALCDDLCRLSSDKKPLEVK